MLKLYGNQGVIARKELYKGEGLLLNLPPQRCERVFWVLSCENRLAGNCNRSPGNICPMLSGD